MEDVQRQTGGSVQHSLFMSCSCHMLHNYVGEVLNTPHFAAIFQVISAILKELGKLPYRQYLGNMMNLRDVGAAPSYTKIRWGSAYSVIKYVFEKMSQILECLSQRHGLRIRYKNTGIKLFTKVREYEERITKLKNLLENITTNIKRLEENTVYIGYSYFAMATTLRYINENFLIIVMS